MFCVSTYDTDWVLVPVAKADAPPTPGDAGHTVAPAVPVEHPSAPKENEE